MVGLILTAVLAMQARHRALKHPVWTVDTQVNDFQRWMVMVPRFLHEGAHYTDDSFPTPPVTLLIFAPYTLLTPANAQLAWALSQYILAAGILALCWRMARRAGVALTPRAGGLILAGWLFAYIGSVQQGQTNLWMLLPLVASLWCAQRSECERGECEMRNAECQMAEGPLSSIPHSTFRISHLTWSILAGVLLALAISIKVTPLIFLPYFLWRRRWLVVGSTVGGLVVWLLLVPALAFGWQANLTWLREWFTIMIVPYVGQGRVDYYVGQSLPSFLTRLLRHVPALVTRAGPVYVNVLDLPEAVANWLIRGVLLALAAAGAWWMRRRLPTLAGRRYLFEIGVVACYMLWASQRTWVPHFVALIFPLTAVGLVLSDPAAPNRRRQQAFWSLIATAALMLFTSDAARIFGRDGPEYARTCGVSLFASVLLVAVLVRQNDRAAGPAAPAPQPTG